MIYEGTDSSDNAEISKGNPMGQWGVTLLCTENQKLKKISSQNIISSQKQTQFNTLNRGVAKISVRAEHFRGRPREDFPKFANNWLKKNAKHYLNLFYNKFCKSCVNFCEFGWKTRNLENFWWRFNRKIVF